MANIKSIVKKSRGEIGLYNLAVDIDESYIANGIVVHNCKSIWAPNLRKNTGSNPKVTGLGSLSKKALESVSLEESKPIDKK